MIGGIIIIGLVLALVGAFIWAYYDYIAHHARGCVNVKTGEYLAGWPPMWFSEYEWVCPK